jgi:hypothetical protein
MGLGLSRVCENWVLYQGTTFIRAAKHHEATKSRRDGRK